MRAVYDRIKAGGWPEITALVGTPEGPNLEVKVKADAKTPKLDDGDRARVAKAVSGLANTDGGCFLFGVRAGNQAGVDTIQRAEPITRLAECLRSVEQAIAGWIDPPIAHVELAAVEDPATPGTGIVAVYVATSDGGPHRIATGTEQGRYYMRAGSNTEIMPHTVLADRFGRRPVAKPRLVADFVSGSRQGETWGIDFLLRNEGRGVARQPVVMLETTEMGLDWRGLGNLDHDKWSVLYGSGNYRPGFVGWEANVNSRVLIYPNTSLFIRHVGHGPKSGGVTDVPLRGLIFCEDAKPVEFDTVLKIDAGPVVLGD